MNVIRYTLSDGTVRYRVKFLFRGMWVQKKGFRSRQEAQAWEVDERRRLENPEAREAPKISFGALTNRYLDSCRTRMQLNTVRAKYKYYCDFLAFLQESLEALEDGTKPDYPAEDITHLQALDYLEELQRNKGSKRANRDLKDLLALYNWANRYRIIQENPFRGIEPFPEDPSIIPVKNEKLRFCRSGFQPRPAHRRGWKPLLQRSSNNPNRSLLTETGINIHLPPKTSMPSLWRLSRKKWIC
jgi:hypothetical protein